MAAAYTVVALTIYRGPPLAAAARIKLDDPPFNSEVEVPITDATTLGNIAGAGILGRIITEVNAKIAGRAIG